jgi:hypothetical protein
MTVPKGELKQGWHEEFGRRMRLPRPPIEALKAIFADTREPKIFLREGRRSADVVVRFATSSPVFSPRVLEHLSKRGLHPSRMFEDVLWKTAGKGNTSIWTELWKLGSEARRLAWLEFYSLSYLGHFHPTVDTWLERFREDIKAARKKPLSGRPQTTAAEKANLRRRYRALLWFCSRIHEAAIRAVSANATTRNTAVATRAARRSIWDDIQGVLYTDRHDDFILSGKAFQGIPYGPAQLHVPESWKPSQLAISVLSLERGLTYQTIEKKLAAISCPKRISGSRK